MAGIIQSYPDSRLITRGEPFATLLRAIVGQQISLRAADTIWARLVAATGTLTPQALCDTAPEALRAAGLSARKVEYVRDLATHVLQGQLEHDKLIALDDHALTQTLIGIRGIGRWTAEMFLIFNLNRPDVWPIDDVGIKKALVRHGWAASLDLPRHEWEALGEPWRPWRTVASWYLWRSLDPVETVY
jgi:DNA-3-methyladenine glycosylase II